eukprot:2555188-Pyramimonas_sp.AAC.1
MATDFVKRCRFQQGDLVGPLLGEQNNIEEIRDPGPAGKKGEERRGQVESRRGGGEGKMLA